MARFAANGAGEITQFLPTYLSEKNNPTPPAGTAYTLTFDETTNAGLVAAYQANSGQFAMNGGTLTQNDVAVTVNPPGAFYAGFATLAEMKAKRDGGPHTWTTEELDRIAAIAFRGAGLE